MADIELVIKIPEEMYERIMKVKNGIWGIRNLNRMEYAIANGTPLPKGHGRLIDADALEYWMSSPDSHYNIMKVVSKFDIDNAPTIIKADKEQSE